MIIGIAIWQDNRSCYKLSFVDLASRSLVDISCDGHNNDRTNSWPPLNLFGT